MARTEVRKTDIVSALATALNGATVNGGTLRAVAQGESVLLTTHSDAGAGGAFVRTYELRVN